MIRIAGLSRRASGKTILESIDLEIHRGEIFTIIGPSGSGKTTILRLIDLLDKPTTGTIIFDGIDTAASNAIRLSVRRRMGMVFQKPAVLNTTVAENVAFGLKFRGITKSEIGLSTTTENIKDTFTKKNRRRALFRGTISMTCYQVLVSGLYLRNTLL